GHTDVTRKGTVAKPGVYAIDLRSVLRCEVQKVWPQLRLSQNQHFRSNSIQIPVDREWQIEGHVKHALFAKTPARQCLAREGRRRNEDALFWELRLQRLNQPGYRQDFAYGNGVNPDRALALLRKLEPRRYHTESLFQSRPIFSRARHSD